MPALAARGVLRFPPTAPIPFGLVAPLGDLGIATCSNTGITIPECCCRECLEDQVRRYRPAVLGGQLSGDRVGVSQARSVSDSEPAPGPIAQAAPDGSLG